MKLIIIGAGPGGYEAAIRAAQLGNEVVLIEKGHTGGTCLNIGCIPTKTLVKIADLYGEIQESHKYGIEVDNATLNPDKIFERKLEVVGKLRDGIEFLLSGYKNLTYVKGFASFEDEKTVIVKTDDGEQRFTADYIIVATGSSDLRILPGNELDHVLTSTDLLALKEIPESMVVIGTGVIGLEFASIYSKFGTKVTVVGNDLLKTTDSEITKRLKSMLKNENLSIVTGVFADRMEQVEDGVKVVYKKAGKDKEQEVVAQYVLLAVGRKSNIEGLQAEKAGIQTERGAIVVDDNLKTSVDHIYAIGDCVYRNIQLAHFASAQGIKVVEALNGLNPTIDLSLLPSVVFTLPEVAQIGKTEDELIEEGVEFEKSKFLYQANGKAVSSGNTEGFLKILASKDHSKILGCHIVGVEADFLIHFAAIAMNNGIGVEGLSNMIYAHPTMSEIFKDAVEMIEGKSINTPGGK